MGIFHFKDGCAIYLTFFLRASDLTYLLLIAPKLPIIPAQNNSFQLAARIKPSFGTLIGD